MALKNTSPIRLCVVQGDGISPEIMAASLHVLRAAASAFSPTSTSSNANSI